jgi:hypothetical protein
MNNIKRYEVIVGRLANKALKSYTKAFLAKLENATSLDSVLAASREPISDAAIRQLYIDTYVTVGTAFAKETISKIKGNKTFTKDIDWYWQSKLTEYAETICGDRIAEVTRTTFEGIQVNTQKALKIATENGWGVAQTAREIARLQNQMERWRALRIARTETIGASNKGSYEGANSTGLKLRKTWVTQEDDSVRRGKQGSQYNHKLMNGKTVEMNEPFYMSTADGSESDAIMFPGDPQGKAGNVINCRCTHIYEVI